MKRARAIRFLGVAASVLCFTLCGLLIALWVRSYYALDLMFGPVTDTQSFVVESVRGRVTVASYQDQRIAPWGMESWGRHTIRFGIDRNLRGAVEVPYWLLAFVFGTVGVAPIAARWRYGLPLLAAFFSLVAVGWALVVAITV